jgi:LysM repeat protein
MLLLSLLAGLAPQAMAQDVLRLTGLSPEASASLPDQYVIVPGDTLWDISAKFYGSPENWPKLWSINEQVTNPHWIYPGNVIVFVPGTEIDPPGLELQAGDLAVQQGYVTPTVYFEEGEIECGPDIRFDAKLTSAQYQVDAILEDSREVDKLGTVYKARTAALAQAERDMIYLELDDASYADCGDIVSILHRKVRKVKHPESRVRYGAMYAVVAEAQIVHIEDDIATAVLRRSYSEVVRGDLVSVRVPTAVELEVDTPSGSLEGVIVARAHELESKTASTDEIVFLDRGRADGVRVGDSFWVVERRDEYMDRDKEDPRLPASVVARIVVVRVDEGSSTAVVVQASRVLETGLHVTQHIE